MKKIKLLAATSITIALFGGCATKPIVPAGTYLEGKNEHGDTFMVIANMMERPAFTSNATYLNNVITYPLQIAAEDTIAKGYRYFSIEKPAQISNTDGIMVNTTSEYVERCANNNILKGLLILTNPCMVAVGSLELPAGGKLSIHMFNQQPQNYMSYDAAKVIADLKEKNLYYDKPRFKGQGEWNKDGKLVFLDLEPKK